MSLDIICSCVFPYNFWTIISLWRKMTQSLLSGKVDINSVTWEWGQGHFLECLVFEGIDQ